MYRDLDSSLINVAYAHLDFRRAWTFTIKTNNPGVTLSNQFALSFATGAILDYVIYHGDGTYDHITDAMQSEVTHTYISSGTYEIKIFGNIQGVRFDNGGDADKMLEISQWGCFGFLEGGDAVVGEEFFGCSNLNITAQDLPLFNIERIHFYRFVRNCTLLTTFPRFGEWVTANVTELQNVFSNTNALTDAGMNLAAADTSNVTTFNNLFSGAKAGMDFSGIELWDVTSLLSAAAMLNGNDITTALYDQILINWEAQSVQDGVIIDFGSTKYTSGGAAATAHAALIADHFWTISDGGPL